MMKDKTGSIYRNPNSSNLVSKVTEQVMHFNNTSGSGFHSSNDLKVGKIAQKSQPRKQIGGRDEKIDSDLYYRVKDENEQLKLTQMNLNEKVKKMEASMAYVKSGIIKERKQADRKVINNQEDYQVDVYTVKMENDKLKDKLNKMSLLFQGMQSEKFGKRYGEKRLTNAKKQYDKQREKNDRLALISHLREELKIAQEDRRNLVTELTNVKQQGQMNMTNQGQSPVQSMRSNNAYGGQMADLSCKYEKSLLQYETNARILELTKQSLADYIEKYESERDKTKELETRLELQKGSIDKIKEYNSLIDDYKQREKILERRIEDLCENPFIKQAEERGNVARRLQECELSLLQTEKKLRTYEEQNRNFEKENRQLKNNLDIALIDKDKFKEDAMRYKITNEEKEKNSKAFEEQFKLLGQYGEVDSNFSKMLSVLKLKNDSSDWANINFLSQMTPEQSKDPEYLCREIERIKIEKGVLGTELEKTKSLLQIQQQINEDMKTLQDYDSKKYQHETKLLKGKIEELCKLVDKSRLPREYEIRNGQVLMHALDKEPRDILVPFKDDNITEFSRDEAEPEFTMNENALDIYIGEADFENGLDRELGFQLENMMSFLSVDFFLHETQTSNLTAGSQPKYNLQLTFRVNLDENFINYIESDYVILEIYYVRDNIQAILGKGKIPLKEIVAAEESLKDSSIVRNTRVVNGICSIFYAKDENLKVASIHYKMRMRAAISEELKWYHEKNKFIDQISPVHNALTTKIQKEMYTYSGGKGYEVKILITEAQRLRISGPPHRLQPYFYYQFYKDNERYSETATGTDPKFQDVATFTVVYDNNLQSYIEKDTLDVYIFDSSRAIEVDCDQDQVKLVDEQGHSDIIGVARIPLKGLLISDLVQGKFAILNTQNQNVGELVISIYWEELFKNAEDNKGSSILPYETKAFEDQLLIKLANVIRDKGLNLHSAFEIFDMDKKREISLVNFNNTIIFTLQFTKNQQEVEHLSKLVFNGKQTLNKGDFTKVFGMLLPHDGPAEELIASRRNNYQSGRNSNIPNTIDTQDPMRFSINQSQVMNQEHSNVNDEDFRKSQTSNMGTTYIGNISQQVQGKTSQSNTNGFGQPANTNRSLTDLLKSINDYMIKHGIKNMLDIFKLFDADASLQVDQRELTNGFIKMGIFLSTTEMELIWKEICGSLAKDNFTYQQFKNFAVKHGKK